MSRHTSGCEPSRSVNRPTAATAAGADDCRARFAQRSRYPTPGPSGRPGNDRHAAAQRIGIR